ncbi:DUF6221 family protein [Streptomyces phaeochromogenes]|uniref:DUF6221 family protein n=1 Tax=Streptomyces phaeochromogenes TaxID=1923 RepID=UPI00224E247D|nr:DUF6221 family protein [Streptomyces phaeochromogenes]MCX5598422.1 DUF6221 family protein [Streptomyces phaeochromogenes]
MIELIRWLGEQLDEDERIARAAADYDDGAAHDVVGPPGTWSCLDEAQWFGPQYRGGVIAPRIGQVNAPELGAHTARHDPARVLREIEAKRDLVRFATGIHDHHETFTTGVAARLEKTLRLYALAYADRPGYREEWKP